ncbi:glucan 4-alpha-glucosidase [Fusarium longipes]|uniref:Glucan 4-alpha-glucosidase n=1 Tax=Fusarium longipes TaxID=694270 RepID=A0A395STZ4_9HYPO|nr:glucan 4-alpha-glucosidase [Fusarium longipes]
MDPHDSKISANSRRSSTRQSRSLRLSAGSAVAEDDYDLDAMMVADGFRPSDNTTASSTTNLTPNSNTQTEPSLSPTEPLSQQTTSTKSSEASSEITPAIRNRPSSISKPHRNHDSLALRNDGTSMADRSHARNNPSLSSDAPVIRAESPYTGPSGPSHPYNMYPQRTMSVATTSTAANAIVPEDRPYQGAQGPAHPYALYTQNTTSGDSSSQSIPVGFNGLGASYQRQLGPDGEEAGDLVGPLGHTEELPPYTRYPDNAYVPRPTAQAPVSPVSPVSEPSSPVRDAPVTQIPGAGGIGIATRDPEFSSTDDDLALPRTRPSVRSAVSSNDSSHDINTAAAGISEKPPVNKWQRRAKKKLCGIVPYWAICLLLVGLVLMGIIMGAVIGTMLTKNHPPPPPSDNDDSKFLSPPTPTTYDPEILTAIPTDLPPMATGRFALPNIDPSPQGYSACFNDTTQSSAWSCDIIYPLWSIEVLKDSDPKKESEISYNLTLRAVDDSKYPFPWGAQPPSIKTVSMKLVNDTSDVARGPAWWLRTTYNKTVIVADKKLGDLSKRGWDQDGGDYEDYNSFHRFKNKPMNAKVGEQPWICTWPNTVIEFFIYPSENATGYHPTPTAGSEVESTTENSYATATTAWDAWKLPVYPHVYKMMERRFLWDEESVATCTQYEVVGDGTEAIPLERNHTAVMITIQEDEDAGFIEGLDLEWTGKGKRSVSQLMRRSSPALTDCACIWKSQ